MYLLVDPSVSGALRISLLASRGTISERICDAMAVKPWCGVHDQSPRSVFYLMIKFLKKRQSSLTEIDALGVILGAGSFTATRLAVCVVNTIGWIYDLPVCGFQSGDKILFKKTSQGFSSFVRPIYGGEPNITFRKKNPVRS